jgi:hypothetical protein
VKRLAIVTVALLAGCGGDDEPRDVLGTSTPVVRSFGYIEAIDQQAGTLRFDAAEFLSGAEGLRAAREDGAIGPEEALSNDYYVRNSDRSPETLVLADEVAVTRVQCNGGCREKLPGELNALAASFHLREVPNLGDSYRGRHTQYWLTIEDGEVKRIDELYLP